MAVNSEAAEEEGKEEEAKLGSDESTGFRVVLAAVSGPLSTAEFAAVSRSPSAAVSAPDESGLERESELELELELWSEPEPAAGPGTVWL